MSEAVIEIRNFEKSFGTKKVHRGISFEVREGECLGLIGGSGQGKSVLLRSIIGLEKPDSGSVHYRGQEVTALSERDLIHVRKKVAYAFQGGALFDSMTVFENLAYPLKAHTQMTEAEMRIKIEGLLNEFGLGGNEKLYPVNLSGGMQKRLGLARALIMGPDVVLYDEPTAGLDPFNTKKIQEMILHLKAKGTTGVLVTHDMPVAFAVCDRIAILSKGQMERVDDIQKIKSEPNHPVSRFASGELS